MVNKIYIEGCDLNFKTTIANKLSEKLGFEVVKGSSFELATMDEKDMYLHMKDILSKTNVIIDRFIYSNRVYAALYQEYTILSDDHFIELDAQIKSEDDDIIGLYLYTNEDNLIERFRKRGDDEVKEDKLKVISMAYDFLWENTQAEPYFIDTGLMNSDEIVELIMTVIELRQDNYET